MRYPTTDAHFNFGNYEGPHVIAAGEKIIPECVVKGCSMTRGRQLPVCTLHHPSVTMRTPEQATALDRRRKRREALALLAEARTQGNRAVITGLRTALLGVAKR